MGGPVNCAAPVHVSDMRCVRPNGSVVKYEFSFVFAAIAHATFIILMCPLSLVARFFFRRPTDAAGFGVTEDGKTFAPSTAVMSSEELDVQHNNVQRDLQHIDVDNGNIPKTESV